MLFGICLTDSCKMQQAKEQCAQEMGLPIPWPMPETPAFYDCWWNKYQPQNGSGNTWLNDVATALGIYQNIKDSTKNNTSYYPNTGFYLPPKSPTVLGMPPAIGYTVLLAVVAGAGFVVYKMASK